MSTDGFCILPKEPTEAYGLDPMAFDTEGLSAYHLHVPQKEMMDMASSSDGSPVSFLSVLLYRTLLWRRSVPCTSPSVWLVRKDTSFVIPLRLVDILKIKEGNVYGT